MPLDKPEKTMVILTFNDRNNRVIVLHANNDQRCVVAAEVDNTKATATRDYPDALILDNRELYERLFPCQPVTKQQ